MTLRRLSKLFKQASRLPPCEPSAFWNSYAAPGALAMKGWGQELAKHKRKRTK